LGSFSSSFLAVSNCYQIFGGGGKEGGVAGWSKSALNLLKYLQGVLLMYWAYIPNNELVIAKNTHLNPSYCTALEKKICHPKKTLF
jgi:hypothetical protein